MFFKCTLLHLKKRYWLNPCFLGAHYTAVTDAQASRLKGAHRSARGEGLTLLRWGTQGRVTGRALWSSVQVSLDQPWRRPEMVVFVTALCAQLASPPNTRAAPCWNPKPMPGGHLTSSSFLVCSLFHSQTQLYSSWLACTFKSLIWCVGISHFIVIFFLGL